MVPKILRWLKPKPRRSLLRSRLASRVRLSQPSFEHRPLVRRRVQEDNAHANPRIAIEHSAQSLEHGLILEDLQADERPNREKVQRVDVAAVEPQHGGSRWESSPRA